MPRRKKDPSLFKIMAVIVVLGAAGFGVLKFTNWFQGVLGKRVEATAFDTMDHARSALHAGDTAAARELLGPILNRVDNAEISPKALALQAEIELANDNKDAALDHLREAVDNYPESPDHPTIALSLARLLENDERYGEAMPIYTSVLQTAPPQLRGPAINALAREKERAGDVDGAYQLYRQTLDEAPMKSKAWEEAARRYGEINVERIFSRAHTEDSKTYTVERGDSLTTIGSKLNTTQGLLMIANGLDNPNRLRPNQTLKYTPKDFEVVIERATCRIYLLDNDGLFKIYDTGLGKPGHDTTIGKYKIGNKEKDPTWHKPGSAPIPPGDPENELGTRWLPLVPEEEGLPTDLGIHGTIQPASIGKYSSMGCPRMHNSEVEELYDLIVRSTPVTVVEEFTPEGKI